MWTRREMIQALGGGFGMLGLDPMLQAAPARGTHFKPRAKRVIQRFMNGGPFHADFFDPKPILNRYAGQRPAAVDLRTENPTGGLMAVPFKYARHGQT